MPQVVPPNGHPAELYLQPGRFVDSNHPAVQAFARAHADASMKPRDIAVKLYYAVRDGFRYDPYHFDMSQAGLKASQVVEQGRGFCVPKATLLAAAARVFGVPARLGFADVRNHLTSPRLREMMNTDVFAFHGYAELMIDGRWVKATPAFNLSLCEKAGVKPLEFDGSSDSIFHEFDRQGRRHMEYIRDRGTYADVPREEMLQAFEHLYPNYRDWMQNTGTADFEGEVRPRRAD
ncbi:transglutaminase-like domain-containing protein [Hydrogenophaga intermedia]|uniref:transglutaminase-like domain-containing protein n=1 Tax=Hydrogenophaga intermedia TaxID=65786 RepID=UPI00204449AA|nr:transglutaminase family protein [Hydrogenophaga intermedia]MCM3562820.1 transglutaminase family protein [Hydrogenophaga intermedia]